MNRLILSFCIPCYNIAGYIEECIASVVSQNLPDDSYEIICCDDCSTDDTMSVIQRIVNENPDVCIRCVKTDINSGVSATRNRLLSDARGEYIWWLDADDALAGGAVRKFAKLLESTQCDVVLGNYYRCYDNLPEEGQVPLDDSGFCLSDIHALPVDQNGTRMCAAWCGVFRRAFLIENHLRFNEKMIAQEDTLYYYETECCHPTVYKTADICYYYRQRSSSIMHTRSVERAKNYYLSMLEMLRVYEEYRDSRRFCDAEIIDDKIRHSEHNVVACLSAVPDTPYVRRELKRLKKDKRYPCRFYKPILKNGLIRNFIPFLNPIPMFFWLNHLLYKAKYSIKR